MESVATVSESAPKQKGKGRHRLTGPGPGRPKGIPNKVSQSIKEAIEAATRPGTCHPQGLTGWLIERAQGGVADRQIFAAMVAKALPLQVQAQGGSGGVTINLAWLAGRGLTNVTPTAQSENKPSTINALKHDTRTMHPPHVVEGEIVRSVDAADPHPPIERQEGVGE